MMAEEFLSDTARLTKRNLLAASLLAIAVKSYNMTVQHIEVAGTKLSMGYGGVAFIVTMALFYLLVSFVIYWIVDMVNIDEASQMRPVDAVNKKHLDREINNIRVDIHNFFQGFYKLNDIQCTNAIDIMIKYSDAEATEALRTEIAPDIHLYSDEKRQELEKLIRKTKLNYASAINFKSTSLDEFYLLLFLRQQVLDFFLPIGFAIYALMVMYGKTSIDPIRKLLPPLAQ